MGAARAGCDVGFDVGMDVGCVALGPAGSDVGCVVGLLALWVVGMVAWR